MKNITILLALGCVLAYVATTQAQCCRASLTLSYRITRRRSTCADAGGRPSGDRCTITICADGKAQVGTYCGRRPCNLFGCACRGGCITGDWQRSFEQRNRRVGVRVIGASWNT